MMDAEGMEEEGGKASRALDSGLNTVRSNERLKAE